MSEAISKNMELAQCHKLIGVCQKKKTRIWWWSKRRTK